MLFFLFNNTKIYHLNKTINTFNAFIFFLISTAEKLFNSWIPRKNYNCWRSSVCQNLANVRHSLSYLDGACSDPFVASRVKHMFFWLFVFSVHAVAGTLKKKILFLLLLFILYSKIFQLSCIVRSFKHLGLFARNYWIMTKRHERQ